MDVDGTAFDFTMTRLGCVMQPDPARPDETEGILNPAATRGRDGRLYLFPRMVAEGNFSRIGKARVDFDPNGNPTGTEFLGYALEPEAQYERHAETGGCEDPRVTYFKPLDVYLMTYTAWGPTGPRIALAVSKDLGEWHRTGRVDFIPNETEFYGTNFDVYHNKDGVIFPDAVPGPDGRPSLAMLHRPVYETRPGYRHDVPPGVDDPRPSIWISYAPLDEIGDHFHGRLRLHHHNVLIDPEYVWEEMRIGGGPPPVMTEHGWLCIYHGVSGWLDPLLPSMAPTTHAGASEKRQLERERKTVVYRAGAMLLDPQDPRRVLYRTPMPVLEPFGDGETSGVVANVVFPTGVDVRTDIGQPKRLDVYYGMADYRVGAATLNLP